MSNQLHRIAYCSPNRLQEALLNIFKVRRAVVSTLGPHLLANNACAVINV